LSAKTKKTQLKTEEEHWGTSERGTLMKLKKKKV
jgi:hypothetical protein